MRIKDFMKRAVVAMLTAAMMVTPIASVHAATTDVIDTSKHPICLTTNRACWCTSPNPLNIWEVSQTL